MIKTLLFLFLLCFSFNIACSQDMYDIKNPGDKYYKKCAECKDLIQNKPHEIQFGIRALDDGNLYFIVTQKEWFDQMFKKSGDGIAIDVVEKSRYDCSKSRINKKSVLRGKVLEPIYLKELKKNMIVDPQGIVFIKLMRVPKRFKDKEVEYNVMFLKSKYICYYQAFFDIKSYRWELLDMGFYFDTLTYRTDMEEVVSDREKYILRNKVMKFEIPFEKNKANYSGEDIKPMYDSLSLTEYNIKKITIRAYSSVEGDLSRNIELQNQRAQSIVMALQSFQKPTIVTKIIAKENWVEFLRDINGSVYSDLATLSKEEIKSKLHNKRLLNEVEPFLKNHRKAVVVLELEKKDKYKDIQIDELVRLFSETIEEQNLVEAVEIQNSIFDKVRNHEAPVAYLNKLEIPVKDEYSLLLNKNSIFKYLMNSNDVFETYEELSALRDLLPNDSHLLYNICALKFKVWLLGESAFDNETFKDEIFELKKMGIDNSLVKRMLINYEILMSEYYMKDGEFKKKDRSLRFIKLNYKYVSLSDQDLLSMAQYFSSYAKYDWATDLLNRKVRSVDVDEDLLFYYLNLTITDGKLTKKTAYRSVLLNAYNINPERFCSIFDPFGQGGVTFQLLEDDFLRDTYCENCNN